jgi:peptide/nickel transport system substrate-binding protein
MAGGDSESKVESVSLGLSGNPSTLDPHATSETLTFQVVKSVYDTLLEPDAQGRLVPALAESWQIGEDNLSIRFTLRRGVKFHDGTDFDSRDVQASLLRILDEDFASPNRPEFEVISTIRTPDAHTLELLLSEPSAPILYSLASGWAAILPSEKISLGHDFALEPVGTGAFSLASWQQDDRITLEKNPSYWLAGSPRIDQVVFRIVPERSLQIQGLISGDLDIAYLVDTEDLPLLKASGEVTIQESLSSLVLVMPMNLSAQPMSDLRFRQAVAMAIDKQQVLDIAYGGGVPVSTFIDAGNPFYADLPDPYPYDPEQAQQLLARSSYKGQEIELALPQNFAPHVRAGELYQEMFRKVGINAKIRLVDWSHWIGEIYGKANYQMTVIGHTGKLDPHGIFAGYGRGGRYVRWQNEEAAALIDQGKSTLAFPQRQEIYRRVQELFAQELPFFYLGSSMRRVAVRSDLRGFLMTPVLDTFDFRRTERVIR